MGRSIETSWDSEDFRAGDTTLLDAMERIFDFLVTDFGFELLYRSSHFRGHDLTYSGTQVRVIPWFDPEHANGDVDLYLEQDLIPDPSVPGRHVPERHARYAPASGLLASMAPDRSWKAGDHLPPYSFAELETAYERWAEGLRTTLAGILYGEGLDKIRWGRAW